MIRDVLRLAHDGRAWLTLRELALLTGYGEASISAQLRNLRKPFYGGHRVTKRRRARFPARSDVSGTTGVWEYWLSE